MNKKKSHLKTNKQTQLQISISLFLFFQSKLPFPFKNPNTPFHESDQTLQKKKEKRMTSVCISNCVNDARDPRVPVRATYVNLYKWPESDAEFVRSVTRRSRGNGMHVHGHPRVVDSISCRQMYLRSYTFSREEDNVNEKTAMCFGRSKEKKKAAASDNNNNIGKMKKKEEKEKDHHHLRKRKCSRKISCAVLFRIFHRLLSCAASVDVVDGN